MPHLMGLKAELPRCIQVDTGVRLPSLNHANVKRCVNVRVAIAALQSGLAKADCAVCHGCNLHSPQKARARPYITCCGSYMKRMLIYPEIEQLPCMRRQGYRA